MCDCDRNKQRGHGQNKKSASHSMIIYTKVSTHNIASHFNNIIYDKECLINKSYVNEKHHTVKPVFKVAPTCDSSRRLGFGTFARDARPALQEQLPSTSGLSSRDTSISKRKRPYMTGVLHHRFLIMGQIGLRFEIGFY